MRSLLRALTGSTRRRRGAGQAITELALITPLCLLLILGGYDVSLMGTDTALTVAAVRHGARLASELGGTNTDQISCTGTLAAGTSLASIDRPIVQTVLAVTTNASYMGGNGAGYAPAGLPEEIDIYRPSQTDGTIDTANDHYDEYVYTDNFKNRKIGPPPYLLSQRCQGPLPHETDIGVRMIWYYRPANGIPGPSFKMIEYAVEKIALCSDNCTPG
ncbi:MAG: TadE/TadG family type IV pilus assembly protein [Candidatus Dormibacteria bacterium]